MEGDSASAAELFALLSAIADVPIRQCQAVTGSVNQHCEIQAVGAVNEKIEGFFDVCRARGLTGEHGVIIPMANTQHLMLRRDVVDAVGQGLFHVCPIRTADEGIELLRRPLRKAGRRSVPRATAQHERKRSRLLLTGFGDPEPHGLRGDL